MRRRSARVLAALAVGVPAFIAYDAGVASAEAWAVQFSGGTAAEGDGSGQTTPAVFTVQLAAPQPGVVAVEYDTVVPAADSFCVASWPTPCAEAGSDYLHATGAVVFAPGETVKTFAVQIVADDEPEITESFPVLVSAPSLGVVESRIYGSIIDDDPAITIDYEVSINEGNSGTRIATLEVTLSAPPTVPVTVEYATATDTLYVTSLWATAGEDFRTSSGRVSFAPGETRKTVSVVVYGDKKREPNETFVVKLSNPVNAGFWNDVGRVWILNDD